MSRQDEFYRPKVDAGRSAPRPRKSGCKSTPGSDDEVTGVEAERLRSVARRQPTKRELWHLALSIYNSRRARERILAQHLFGEPAWDILLTLYCLPIRGELLSVTSLAYAASTAPSTSLRWQAILTREGLVERGSGGEAALRLSPYGRGLLDEYFEQLFYCQAGMQVRTERVLTAVRFP